MGTRIKAKIAGTAPYIQHRYVQAEKGRGKNIPTPEDEAERAAYKNEDGFYIPATQVKAAMVKAAVDYKYQGKKSFKQFVKAGVIVTPAEIPLSNKDFEIFSIPVVIQRSRIVRSRPLFRKWEAEFEIVLIDPLLKAPIIKQILVAAGAYKGLGDFRPEYGRFEVESFKVVK